MMRLATEMPNNKRPRGDRKHQGHVKTCWKATGIRRLELCKQEGKTQNQEQKPGVQSER